MRKRGVWCWDDGTGKRDGDPIVYFLCVVVQLWWEVRDIVTWRKHVVATGKHAFGKMLHDRLGLEV